MRKIVSFLTLAIMLVCIPSNAWANAKKTVAQVTTDITIDEDVDYIAANFRECVNEERHRA